MKWKLDFSIPTSAHKIQHTSHVILLGSCFSDEMETYFKKEGFSVLSNPFGTIFHPMVLANQLLDALLDVSDFTVFKRQDIYFSWQASGTVFEYSEAALVDTLAARRSALKTGLATASHLVITLGSAFGYVENNSGEIVANCHKMPSDMFHKSLTDLELMKSTWSKVITELHRLNPLLQVVFTVSPVRHIKDGLIENNRSKARLFELIQSVCEHLSVAYFPAYEIVMDELRDYRFFKADGYHPNDLAIEYVWERFKATFMTPTTIAIGNEYQSILRLKAHKIVYESSLEAENFKAQVLQKQKAFCLKYPFLTFD
jgi:hypothetical protein